METQTDFNPAIFEEVAEHLHMDVRALERESLRAFLERRLTALHAEKFRITEKYGVKTVAEMEQLYREKQLAEQGTWEDFFELDHIETEQAAIERVLEKLQVYDYRPLKTIAIVEFHDIVTGTDVRQGRVLRRFIRDDSYVDIFGSSRVFTLHIKFEYRISKSKTISNES